MQMKFCKFDKEKQQATFINESKGCQVRVSAQMLPEAIRLGDSVEIAILPDVQQLQEMQSTINSLLTSVTSLKRNQIQEMKENAYKQVILAELRNLVRGSSGNWILVNLHNAAESIAKALCGERKSS